MLATINDDRKWNNIQLKNIQMNHSNVTDSNHQANNRNPFDFVKSFRVQSQTYSASQNGKFQANGSFCSRWFSWNLLSICIVRFQFYSVANPHHSRWAVAPRQQYRSTSITLSNLYSRLVFILADSSPEIDIGDEITTMFCHEICKQLNQYWLWHGSKSGQQYQNEAFAYFQQAIKICIFTILLN